MKTKVKSIIVVIIAVATGYVISNPLVFHICANIYQFGKDTGCLDDVVENVGTPLFIFSTWLLLVVIVTAFFSENIFHFWLKFSAWTIPLLIIFIVLTPVSSYRMGINFFPFYRDDAARLAGELFSGISLILIIWKSIVLHRTRRIS